MTQFIGGKWSKGSGQVFASLNPATGGEVWSGSASDVGDVDRAVSAARAAFIDWSMTSFDERLKVIRQYGNIVAEKKKN